jgi:hypothetical protein
LAIMTSRSWLILSRAEPPLVWREINLNALSAGSAPKERVPCCLARSFLFGAAAAALLTVSSCPKPKS